MVLGWGSTKKLRIVPNSMGQARAKDRISELPDELACHILSFLPTTWAVRTTVLSKRWNNIWAKVPNLDFDADRDFHYSGEDYDGNARFKTFVDNVLLLRGSTNIKKFSLKRYVPENFSVIESWIRNAVWRNVVELDLDLSTNYETIEFPRFVFRSKTLEVLTVCEYGPFVTYHPPAFGCFPSLKSLHIRLEQSDKDSMEKLFTYCPVLEHLTIDGYLENEGVYNIKVNAPQLKTFRVCLDGSDKTKFYIDAPKLESLDFHSVPLSSFSLENVNSLVKARIAFNALSEAEQSSFPNLAVAHLVEISDVKHLHLTAHCLEAWYFPALDNLKQLTLILYDCNYWKLLKAVLDRSPNLEDLVINDETKCDKKYSKAHWNGLKIVPNCLASHLKTISIKGFRGRRIEMEVVKYLILNGYRLDKITIYARRTTNKLYEELLMNRRASMTCQVEVIKMTN